MESEGFTRNDWRAVAAEFLGTAFFVFFACGAVVAAKDAGGAFSAPLTAISLAFGLGIFVAVAWTAGISGGHINPAVTLAMLLTGHIKLAKGIAYMVAQFLGGIGGAILLKLAVPNRIEEQATFTQFGRNSLADNLLGEQIKIHAMEGLLFEILGTAFLVLVVYHVAVSKKGWNVGAPAAVGLAVALIHFALVPFTGTSVNPARTLGPDVAANDYGDLWVFLLGPALGAVLAAAVWRIWRTLGDDLEAGAGATVDTAALAGVAASISGAAGALGPATAALAAATNASGPATATLTSATAAADGAIGRLNAAATASGAATEALTSAAAASSSAAEALNVSVGAAGAATGELAAAAERHGQALAAVPQGFAGAAPAPPTGRIKGNINQQGEKIYHAPGSRWYDLTDAESWFDSIEEAEAAGYRPPRQFRPGNRG